MSVKREREKYRQMWAFPEYRIFSPGEVSVDELGPNTEPGQSLIDLGCGTGRAARLLSQKYGLNVTMLDFCPEALEVFDLPFVEANLWDLPPLPQYDWIYCVDVLEHIPFEWLHQTLDNLAWITKRGGFLKIACFPDGCGALINDTLHLTVRSPEWWYAEVAARWSVSYDMSNGGYAVFLLGEPHYASY